MLGAYSTQGLLGCLYLNWNIQVNSFLLEKKKIKMWNAKEQRVEEEVRKEKWKQRNVIVYDVGKQKLIMFIIIFLILAH